VPDAHEREPKPRFPVIVCLHGYVIVCLHGYVIVCLHGYADPSSSTGMMDRSIASERYSPMIVVFPNGLNKYRGSFYANSSTTGNWEDYVVRDVVLTAMCAAAEPNPKAKILGDAPFFVETASNQNERCGARAHDGKGAVVMLGGLVVLASK
jgi:hypothetical protein